MLVAWQSLKFLPLQFSFFTFQHLSLASPFFISHHSFLDSLIELHHRRTTESRPDISSHLDLTASATNSSSTCRTVAVRTAAVVPATDMAEVEAVTLTGMISYPVFLAFELSLRVLSRSMMERSGTPLLNDVLRRCCCTLMLRYCLVNLPS